MDCVVTGGAGFIGSNLVDALIDRGDRVAVIDNLSTGKRVNLERAVAGAKRVVNSSTGGGLYGDADVLPTPEDHPIRPLAPYGQSKLCGEGYCELYARLHGLPTVSLRYGNVYGPRQDVHGEAGVVAIFCGRLIEGERPTVFGDGLQTRDYVFVEDVVASNLAAAGSDASGSINIGTGVQ